MLKMYMGYSAGAGSSEGAALIFAHKAREAKEIGWKETSGIFTEEYIDFAVRIIRGHEWLYKEADQEKLANDIPHVVIDVHSCSKCEMWGDEILKNGLCESCNNDVQEVNHD